MVKTLQAALRQGKNFSALLFGGSCFLCRGSARELLCEPCMADLPRLDAFACPRCALASPSGRTCGRCLATDPSYDATIAALGYAFPADTLIHALKFSGELSIAPLLAATLLEKLPRDAATCIVPVPLSAAKLRLRGYNQAAEIARRLASGSGVGLDVSLCERALDTPPQSELPWAERARNVRGAFRCTRSIDGATIAVVDDVMTTGATLDEMARTLKKAGARRVVNWVVARTAPPD